MTTTHLPHGKVQLALHQIESGVGPPLLVLHGLGTSAPERLADGLAWPGPVFALDFTGHGQSDIPAGGGYTAELLMADVDVALAHLGPSTVLGYGLGAWIALLISGARPELVRGAVLADGPGLVGGGVEPGSHEIPQRGGLGAEPPDRFAVVELGRDLRPGDYAGFFAQLAVQGHTEGLRGPPLTLTTRQEAPWLGAVAAVPGVARGTVAEALSALS